jgi:monooxygenase
MDKAGPATEDLDVLIVGAGLSGIGAAVHLQRHCPGQRYAVLEARQALGGTWDLFRYPGVRSDSDMYTLGYHFKPWRDAKAIADGPAIRAYIAETAAEHGITPHIRFGHQALLADWDSASARWTLQVAVHDESGMSEGTRSLRCRILLMCSGYYRYDRGHQPHFEGQESFAGRLVHPQFWPQDLRWAGQRVVVIGSGATAVTLVPALAAEASHVTLLQRSPSYVVPRPAVDGVAAALQRWLPARAAYALVRLKNVAIGQWYFQLARRWPQKARERIAQLVQQHLGPDAGVDTHFNPRYAPWDQRVCLVPDGDLLRALRSGRAEMVTDTLEGFTERGLRLASGRELVADIVVSATGLELALAGGMRLQVDGVPVDLGQAYSYKGLMFSGVPNLVYTFGYTNASWTLKADLTARWACRLIHHLQRQGLDSAVPQVDASVQPRPFLDFSSGYVQRAQHLLPRQGQRAPWRLHQNYFRDWALLRWGRLDDGVLRLAKAGAAQVSRVTPSSLQA